MIYIDTSSFLKVLLPEPESAEVIRRVLGESRVVFSVISLWETEVQLRAARLGGRLNLSRWEKSREKMLVMIDSEPFQRVVVSASLFETAIRQHMESDVHCRSLDRLHLAAMEEMGIKRLMTHDHRQAEAARERGIEVTMPGIE